MEDGGTESSTLPCRGDLHVDVEAGREAGVKTAKDDRTSVRSDVVSCTESERELTVKSERRGGGGAYEQDETVLLTHLDKKGEEPVENQLPEKAAQVFAPALSILHSSSSSPMESQEIWEMESQKSPFLIPQGTPHCENQFDWEEDTPPSTCGCGCPPREVLKVGVSLMSAAMFFPFLAWGGYVFLPFDAPLLNGAPHRLVYTLRCSVFATTPIILSWLVLGASRLKNGVIRPLFDDVVKEAGTQVSVHRRFLSDSCSLFLIYFLQLVILAMYLSQEQLKLVPLLAIIFAFGRLVYWVAAACGSSVRSFGFGLSFLPSIAMMVVNFYFVFTVEAARSIFSHLSPPEEILTAPDGKQRFWG